MANSFSLVCWALELLQDDGTWQKMRLPNTGGHVMDVIRWDDKLDAELWAKYRLQDVPENCKRVVNARTKETP